MNIKKYYAEDMQDALLQIKEELGPDAVIISSKMVRSRKGILGWFSPKIIEVVAAHDDQEKPEPKKKPAPPLAAPITAPLPGIRPTPRQEPAAIPYVPPTAAGTYGAAAPPRPQSNMADNKQTEAELAEIKRMIERVSSKVDGIGKESISNLGDEAAELYRRLTDRDVDEALANKLCVQAQEISVRRGGTITEVMSGLILEELGAPVFIEPSKLRRKVIMIIGPTGVGKTTTLVKLASDLIVNQGLRVGVINSDVYRVGAQEQLKIYCEILGVPMHTIYKPEEVTEALDQLENMDVILLDTAGKVSRDADYQREISELVERSGVDQIYLALSASTSVRTMKEILANYEFLGTHIILLTKLDEVSARGMVLNAAHYGRRPLSYMAVGQAVPDDLVRLDPETVTAELMREDG